MRAQTQPTLQRITTRDGVDLAVHRLGPADGTPVLLAHGTFSNSTFWLGTRGTGLARVLAERGFDAWVLDFRGHGASPRPARGQRWNFDDWGRFDIPAAVSAIAGTGRHPLLVGHSAGGVSMLAALAGEFAIRDTARGVLIAATPLPWLQRWRRVSAHILRFGSRHLPAFPARLLRLGPEDELPGVMEQWMNWNLDGRWIGNDGTDYVAALAHLTLPVLLLAGAGDRRFAPPDACRGLFDALGSTDKHFVLAGTAAGFARDYDHVDLIVSREARAEIWPLIIAWLGKHV